MRSIILLSLVCWTSNNFFNCINAASIAEPKRLQVEVFYETLCPDSMRFVRHQLYTSVKANEWLPYIDLRFIPYGKVGVWTDPATNVTNLYCQHGHRECELNALHACFVEHNTMADQLEIINCLLNGYSTDVDDCSKDLKIDVTAAKSCKNNRKISDILKKHGDKTDAIEISFVPSISIDGVFDRREQQEILHNFSRVFCRKYKKIFDITLEKC